MPRIRDVRMINIVYKIDCLAYMMECPDKMFDLAIVDPPYGINAGNMTMGKGISSKIKKSNWDNKIPDEKYFDELFRVNKNQIIFGGNYFKLPTTNSWIVWDKDRKKNISYSDGELLWTSFGFNLKIYKYKYDGFLGADVDCRIHKAQKPINFYKWLLQNYAKPGWTIFDSHIGSGSSRIACHDLGFDFVGCELDKYYWQAQEERFQNHVIQSELFDKSEYQELIYGNDK